MKAFVLSFFVFTYVTMVFGNPSEGEGVMPPELDASVADEMIKFIKKGELIQATEYIQLKTKGGEIFSENDFMRMYNFSKGEVVRLVGEGDVDKAVQLVTWMKDSFFVSGENAVKIYDLLAEVGREEVGIQLLEHNLKFARYQFPIEVLERLISIQGSEKTLESAKSALEAVAFEIKEKDLARLYELFNNVGKGEAIIDVLDEHGSRMLYAGFVQYMRIMVLGGRIDRALELTRLKIEKSDYELTSEHVRDLYDLFINIGRKEAFYKLLLKRAETQNYRIFVDVIELIVDKGNADKAYELTKDKLEKGSSLWPRNIDLLEAIFIKSGNKEWARQLAFHNIEKRLLETRRLLGEGKMEEAREYGSRYLEAWESQSDELVYKNLNKLLELSIIIDSEYYYKSLKDKASRGMKEGEVFEEKHIQKFEPYWKTRGLGEDETGGVSMIDVLVSRMQLDPAYLKEYGISEQSFRYGLEHMLYDLSKTMTKLAREDAMILFDVLNVLAVDFLKNPQERIYLFLEHPEIKADWVGLYVHDIKSITVTKKLLNRSEFQGTLMHEMTHKLMEILFDNRSRPYWMYGEQRDLLESKFKEAIDKTKALLTLYESKAQGKLSSAIDTLKGVNEYSEYSRHNEYIVRLIEIIAEKDVEDDKVKDLIQPLYEYWRRYVNPEIKRYLKENAQFNRFMSNWQREYLLDPIYAQSIYSKKMLINQAQKANFGEFVSIIEQLVELKAFDEVEKLIRGITKFGYGLLLDSHAKRLYELLKSSGKRELGVLMLEKWAGRAYKEEIIKEIDLLIDIAELDRAFEVVKMKASEYRDISFEHLEQLYRKFQAKDRKDLALALVEHYALEGNRSVLLAAVKLLFHLGERDKAMDVGREQMEKAGSWEFEAKPLYEQFEAIGVGNTELVELIAVYLLKAASYEFVSLVEKMIDLGGIESAFNITKVRLQEDSLDQFIWIKERLKELFKGKGKILE